METKVSESSDMVSKDTGRERQEWQSSSFLVSTESNWLQDDFLITYSFHAIEIVFLIIIYILV